MLASRNNRLISRRFPLSFSKPTREKSRRTLLPRFQIQQETVIKDFSDVIRAAAALVKKLDSSQAKYEEAAAKLNEVLDQYRDEMHRSGESLDEMVELLKRGFRLSEHEE